MNLEFTCYSHDEVEPALRVEYDREVRFGTYSRPGDVPRLVTEGSRWRSRDHACVTSQAVMSEGRCYQSPFSPRTCSFRSCSGIAGVSYDFLESLLFLIPINMASRTTPICRYDAQESKVRTSGCSIDWYTTVRLHTLRKVPQGVLSIH